MMNSLFIRARTLTVTGESVTLIFNTVLPTVHTVHATPYTSTRHTHGGFWNKELYTLRRLPLA